MEKLSLNDVIKRERDSITGKRKAFFPTLIVCSGCGGYAGIYFNGKTYKDPKLSFHIALIQYGHTIMPHCDNLPPTHACNCEQRLVELRDKTKHLKDIIISDTGWGLDEVSSEPTRGIRNYNRTIKFSRALSRDDEFNNFCELLQRDECPGWTGVYGCSIKEGVYTFSTTWDSSD